ncbi:MAG: ABC transporter permease [Anaerolineae bacterium]|jgi:lipopolysaccharide transport system permease protein|nr:ABC transporter permease [Anaerolineae bacterium]
MKTDAIETVKKPDTVIIQPMKGLVALNLRDLWIYRELVYFLTWRDLKVRYKQSVLGVLWAIINPLVTTVVFAIIFGNFAKFPSDGVPYPIFSYTATLPWTFFAAALTVSARSMLTSGGMVSKIYFPRIIVPLSSVFANLADFLVGFVIMIGMLIFYRVTPTLNMLWLPAFLLLATITALGVGLWFSALLVMYRDINYLLPFLTTIWMYLSPVVYASSTIPEQYRILYSLNPMVGVIEGFRWALLGTQQSISPSMIAISSGIALLIFITGLFFFRRMERIFADMI